MHVRFWPPSSLQTPRSFPPAVLACPTLAITTIFTMGVSIVTLAVEREAQPHHNRSLGGFTYAMHWQIVMLVLFSLLTDAGFTEGPFAVALSGMLAFANVLLIGNVMWSSVRMKARNCCQAHESSALCSIRCSNCLYPIHTLPLARHTLDRRRRLSPKPHATEERSRSEARSRARHVSRGLG